LSSSSGEGDAICQRCGAQHETAACPIDLVVTQVNEAPAAPQPPGLALVPPTPGPDPLLGAMVGSFRVQRLLGRGGMGSVYLAEHPVIGSKVAIKFLHESMCASPELVGRFYDEARAVNLIGHENIVAIYDLALLPPSRYYIVMEYLDGVPLSELIRAGRVAPLVALDVLLQLADALRAAHERGVVHRDLKPDNVFLLRRHGREHFVKLVDFGIAKLGDRTSGARTAAGMIVGTPEYMAPEQCTESQVDRRTDIYAPGVMAYEVATGQLPFTGTTIPHILLAQVRDPPRPPRQHVPTLPEALDQAIMKALEKRPEDRFQTMGEMAAALDAARRELSTQAARTKAAPAAAPAPANDVGVVEVEVRGPDGVARRHRATQASHGGMYLAERETPPPLFTRVRIALPGPGGATVELAGEVVRHVTAADAARWRMAPGYAVQLGATGAEGRAALDALVVRLCAAEPPATAPAPIPVAAALSLEALERRAAAGPYELLGAPADAGFPEIREQARAVRAEIEALRPRLPPDQQASRVPALLARLDAAAGQLSSPGERLLFDARRGNFRGIAHCVTAGASPAVVESRRRALLAEQPGREAEAQRLVARARVAAKLGNAAAALATYESALRADPLDLRLHEEYAAARLHGLG
jgi:eukaryotic-like serine/threonine-protein kinase